MKHADGLGMWVHRERGEALVGPRGKHFLSETDDELIVTATKRMSLSSAAFQALHKSQAKF